MKSFFCVVEGTDGSGTTTCSKLLAQTLHELGVESLWTKEPSDGTVGRHIRKILKREEAADELGMFPLFLADRHDHIAGIIRPTLNQGVSVICDRYAYSTWVYQQDNYEPFLIEYVQRSCLAPDIVFVLTCPVKECMRRMGNRGVVERYELEEQQKLYYERYKNVPRLGNEKIVYVDSHKLSVDQVVDTMLNEIGM